MEEQDKSQNINVNNLNQENLLPNTNIEMRQRHPSKQQQNPRRPLFLPYGSNDVPFPNQFTQIKFLIQP